MSRASSAPSSSQPSSPVLRAVGHANNLRPLAKAAPKDPAETEAVCRFIQARHKLGLTQAGAAEVLEVSERAVASWESGKARIPAWALVEIERRAA